jgi:dolichol-phosphate mannosyltransferase
VSTTIIVPCKDEADNVPRLVAELGGVAGALAADDAVDILFVDDGSADDTAERIQAHTGWPVPVRVVRHPRNLGLGAAVRTGFAHAGGNRVVTTDADGTFDFRTIPELLGLLRDDVSVVVASPYHPSGGVAGVPAYRLVLSRGASALYRILVDRRVHTYTSIFRAYRGDLVHTVPFDSDGYPSQAEILVNVIRAGAKVAEYPCTLHVRRFGQSKARVAQIILAHVRLLWRIVRTPRTHPVSTRRAGHATGRAND